MTTVKQKMAKTDKMVRRVRAGATPPQDDTPKKEPIDWREEFKDEWDYHGIIYTIGKTLAWVLVLSVMFGVIYGSLITEQI